MSIWVGADAATPRWIRTISNRSTHGLLVLRGFGPWANHDDANVAGHASHVAYRRSAAVGRGHVDRAIFSYT